MFSSNLMGKVAQQAGGRKPGKASKIMAPNVPPKPMPKPPVFDFSEPKNPIPTMPNVRPNRPGLGGVLGKRIPSQRPPVMRPVADSLKAGRPIAGPKARGAGRAMPRVNPNRFR